MATMYFGTVERFQYVKCALSDMPSDSVNWSTVNQKQRGTASVNSSRASHRVFDMSWNGTAAETGVFKDYQAGLYGTGLIYFTLPNAEHTNLFAPNWAAPRLIEVETGGWPQIYDATGTFSATTANSYHQPPRSITYTTVASIPTKRFLIPLPPTKKLHLGWTGSSTSSGKVYYRVMLADGTYATPVALTAIGPTSSTRLNASITGNATTAVAVEVYLYGAGTVTVTSLCAQLWDTAVSPTLTGDFYPGRGHTGCEFAGAVTESIVQDTQSGKQLFTMNATLVETGQ